MCDPGMDGDVYDTTTDSGKRVGAQPVWKDGRLQYEPEPRVAFGQSPRRQVDRSVVGRLKRAWRILRGKE